MLRRARRHLARRRILLRAALQAGFPSELPDRYFIKAGYIDRTQPEYDSAELWGPVTWQPDVYPEVQRIANRLDAPRIVDIGCGDGAKLAPLAHDHDVIGIDYGSNLIDARGNSYGTWLEHDIDTDAPLPLSEKQLDRCVIVAADVIEHLVNPEKLLRKIHAALEHAAAAVISTPERNLTHGVDHLGPPRNKRHAREWSVSEFAAFLASEGFHDGTLNLTRTNDLEAGKNTIMVVIPADAGSRRAQQAIGGQLLSSALP